MKKEPIIKPIETTYWKPIRTIRNFRPETDNPKLPFRTNAGWKEVIYHAGYSPAITPSKTAIPSIINNKGI